MFKSLKSLWYVMVKKADFKQMSESFGINIVTARMLCNRDVVTDEDIRIYLKGSEKDFFSPWHLKDMEKAVNIISRKIKEGKNIRIIGDYDIDGVTSSYILYKGLHRLGAECTIRIPHRIYDGYGMNETMIEEAISDNVDTIITCDNGIAAAKEIALAKENGMTVIVTDHHEVPYELSGEEKVYRLPGADAIINPKQEDCPYENKNICGAVVAMKFIAALYEYMGIDPEEIREFYEFAAIATVGDVMDLKGENRIIVKEGLKRIPSTSNVGLRALIKACSLNDKAISAYHIGFVIGPCINASGRLETARMALELFQCPDIEEAEHIAEELVNINQSRKDMTEEGVLEAVEWVEASLPSDAEAAKASGGIDRVLVVYLPECHESLAGIIAGRLRERYSRPVFVLTDARDGVKGSGRSIEEYSMYDELVKCSHLFTKFGGHPMAAGISLNKENVEEFRTLINRQCSLTPKDLSPKLHIDAEMPLAMVDFDVAEELRLLEPFGKGNTKPCFVCKNLSVSYVRVMGRKQNVVKMQLTDSYDRTMTGVYFSDAGQFIKDLGDRKQIYAIVYYPDINEYNGRRSLQIIISDYLMDKPM